MRKLSIAAAALLFGTSAYAMVPSTEPTGVQVDKDPYTVMGTTAVTTAGDAFKLQPASADWWGTAEPVTFKTDAAALSASKFDEADAVGKADVALASSDEFAAMDEEWDAIAARKAAAEEDDAGAPEFEPASAEATVLDEEPLPVENGVGGPYEGVETAAAGLSPRPASQNYPACRPGPGDDRCIQLYEPGVREELASWDRSSGGLAGTSEMQVADSSSETERLNQQALAASTNALQSTQMAAAASDSQLAVGGPYEPVDEAMLSETATSGDGSVDTAMGEIEEDEEVGV